MGRKSVICVGDDLKRRSCKLASQQRTRAYPNTANAVFGDALETLFHEETVIVLHTLRRVFWAMWQKLGGVLLRRRASSPIHPAT